MKKLLAAFISLFTIHYSLLSQDVVTTTIDLIKQHKFQQANRYLDSVLKKSPRNVDALMMKGNVALNYSMDTTAPMRFITADDISVFTSEISEKPKLVPKKTVYQVEKIWRKCLQMDSSRNDIRKGLCTMYAIALMKDSLKNEMKRLQYYEKDNGEQPFQMSEYARKFKERNRFDDAMDLYKFIAQMYPAVAGVRCDIASEYFYEGKTMDALLWLDSCYQFKTVDETSFLNGAFTYSLLGFYDDAQSVLAAYSRIYKRKMDGFYYGLMLFSDSSQKYYPILYDFVQTVDTNTYYTEYHVAKTLMAYHDTFTLNNYKAIVDDKEIPDYYKGLIHQRAMRQFKSFCEPFLVYGTFQSSIKNYSAAVQLLEGGENCKMKTEQNEYWMLHFAFAQYKFGEKEKALAYFKPLLNSTNLFTQHAAKYFTGLMLAEKKKNEEAAKLFAEVAGAKSQTKYSYLAKLELKK